MITSAANPRLKLVRKLAQRGGSALNPPGTGRDARRLQDSTRITQFIEGGLQAVIVARVDAERHRG